MNGLNQDEIKLLLTLLQRMNLKQIQKVKEIIPEVEKSILKQDDILNRFNDLFKTN